MWEEVRLSMVWVGQAGAGQQGLGARRGALEKILTDVGDVGEDALELLGGRQWREEGPAAEEDGWLSPRDCMEDQVI